MFSRPDVVSLTNWPAGHVFGLWVRWQEARGGDEEFVEIYRLREPEVVLWQLRKPALDVVLVRQACSGRLVQVGSVVAALEAVLGLETAPTTCAARIMPGVDLHR